jgi:hypothetical protein
MIDADLWDTEQILDAWLPARKLWCEVTGEPSFRRPRKQHANTVDAGKPEGVTCTAPQPDKSQDSITRSRFCEGHSRRLQFFAPHPWRSRYEQATAQQAPV